MRILVTGWPSFIDGVATAGDVLSMEAVRNTLVRAGTPCDMAWSPVLRPDGLTLERADPSRYTHLIFACGPVHGTQVESLHRRYAHCRRIAVGVSVVDPRAPAVTGFHVVLPRDAPGAVPQLDLSIAAPVQDQRPPVVGVVLAPGQGEYGARGQHEQIQEELTRWLGARDCARVPLDTRLDSRDWRHPTTPGELESVIRRLDLVVTTRLHGLVLALRNGVPVLAVDPVANGAKVTAQARVWDWPAIITTTEQEDPPFLDRAALDHWWDWCMSNPPDRRSSQEAPMRPSLLSDLTKALEINSGSDLGRRGH